MTDSASAEHAATDRSSRRALLGASALGAALALASSNSVRAAATGDLSADDLAIAAFAIGLELAARDLYQAAIDGGAEGIAWPLLRDQHESYADRMAGIAGLSANSANASVVSQLEEGFAGDRPANAAFGLENTAAASHVALLAAVTDAGLADAMASIVTMESRHAAYLAERAGRGDDFDALFVNAAAPIAMEASS